MELTRIVPDFARAMGIVDTAHPAGIGTCSRSETVQRVANEISRWDGYSDPSLDVPFGPADAHYASWCVGEAPDWSWTLQIRLLKMRSGDGRPVDGLTGLVSPWATHDSALVAAQQLYGIRMPHESRIRGRKAVIICGYESDDTPLHLGIEAFEALLAHHFRIGDRVEATVGPLQHAVYTQAGVYGWELMGRK